MVDVFKNIGRSIKKARPRKHYLEFITAALSIPVLLSVILLNWNSLQNEKKQDAQPTVAPIIIREGSSSNSNPVPTDSQVCKKEIGPISISYPKEGAIVTENPLNIIIKYDNSEYCSVVWSYRINGGVWSEFSSNSPSIYNMPNGDVTFELRVQSTVTEEQEQLTRNFTYDGEVANSPTLTTTITPTP